MIQLSRRLAIGALAALTVTPLWAEGEAPAATTPAAPVIEVMSLGNPDATVTVIEYASFTCPHCANFHKDVFEQLKADYIDTGKINFVYREVYFDRFGLWAGMLARCGGKDKYFPVAKMIYETQQVWIGDGQPATIAENLKKIGLTVGMTGEQVDACLNDQVMAEALVADFQANMDVDQIEGTPTFIINGEKTTGEMPYEQFKAMIDTALAG
jgi:protein-disulfide isomerase